MTSPGLHALAVLGLGAGVEDLAQPAGAQGSVGAFELGEDLPVGGLAITGSGSGPGCSSQPTDSAVVRVIDDPPGCRRLKVRGRLRPGGLGHLVGAVGVLRGLTVVRRAVELDGVQVLVGVRGRDLAHDPVEVLHPGADVPALGDDADDLVGAGLEFLDLHGVPLRVLVPGPPSGGDVNRVPTSGHCRSSVGRRLCARPTPVPTHPNEWRRTLSGGGTGDRTAGTRRAEP